MDPKRRSDAAVPSTVRGQVAMVIDMETSTGADGVSAV